MPVLPETVTQFGISIESPVAPWVESDQFTASEPQQAIYTLDPRPLVQPLTKVPVTVSLVPGL